VVILKTDWHGLCFSAPTLNLQARKGVIKQLVDDYSEHSSVLATCSLGEIHWNITLGEGEWNQNYIPSIRIIQAKWRNTEEERHLSRAADADMT
jgi:hypothetical protein